MTILHTLASGSSGNAILVSQDHTHLLVDAGISCRRIKTALAQLHLTIDDLSGILITHTHGDHIKGLQTTVKHHDVPIYASSTTANHLAYRIAGIEPRLRPVTLGQTLSVGACEVTPFETSHDAPGSTGYRVGNVGVLTDSGYVTEQAADTLAGVPLLVLEANHDVETLRCGPYPYFLKQRILSEQGHLSNDAAGSFAVSMAQQGTREIILAHLSAENNTPAIALRTVTNCLSRADFDDFPVSVAPRETLSRAYETEGVAECSA